MENQPSIVLKFKVKNLRRVPNPFGEYLEGKKTSEMYELLVNVMDVPNNVNLKTNPRLQNMKTKVVSKIKEGLLTDNRSFHILNRGIVISAKDLKFDNVNSEVIVILEDESVHGNVDGGHTYKVILENRNKMNHIQYVKIQIITGIEEIFEDVAAARNTSVQVQDAAIAELKQKFELIKNVISGEPFENEIAYKENEDKDIEIADILSILYMFNLHDFPGRESMPTNSFNAKHVCVKHFIKTYDEHVNNTEDNPYYKLRKVMVDIFKLYDRIEQTMGDKYREFSGSGRYGLIKGVIIGNSKTKFYHLDISYKHPKGFIYPILGSFRALLHEKDGLYEWRDDPFEYFESIGKDLVGETVERSRSLGNNPGSVGKDSGHWKQLYQNVLTHYLLKQMQ